MPKKYKYVNGKKMIVVNNYDLGTDIIPEEEQIVPDPLVTDVGKVLTVNQAGNPAWADAPEELPALTGNAGKVLKVASGASGVEWADETSDLPAVTSEDAGDVLTVSAEGEWEAAAPGGGGGGLTLYGPYYAESASSKTLEAGQVSDITLSYLTNYDGDTLSAPAGRYNAFFMNVFGVNGPMSAKLNLMGFSVPYEESGYMIPAQVSIGNDGDTDITLYPYSYGVMFYSDVEFNVVT